MALRCYNLIDMWFSRRYRYIPTCGSLCYRVGGHFGKKSVIMQRVKNKFIQRVSLVEANMIE